ncbi:glycosyltransferase family 39 protein [Candidatus Woesebacteria bacterium]|nr:glycosyltransferase family 39 protein [Candidatus Woesebacteria bacterium]
MIKKIGRSRIIIMFLLFAIVFLGLVLRGFNLFVPVADWHSFRQADTISVSRVFLEEGIDLFKPRYHDVSNTQSGLFNPNGYRMVEFPVYNSMVAYSYKLFPIFTLEAWGRITSIFSAVVTAYIIFLLMKRFTDFKIGLLSSLVYLIIPFNIYFTRSILPEPMATMFAVLSLWLFVRHFDMDDNKILLLSAFSMSLAILIKPYVFFYAAPMIFLIFEDKNIKEVLKLRYILFSLIIIVPIVLWRLWINRFPEGIPFWKWTMNGDGIRFKPAFFRWLFSERIGKLILGVWGTALFVLGLSGKDRKARFFQSLILGVFIYFSIFATANVRHDYYQTIIIPAIVMVFSYGGYVFIKSEFGKVFKALTLTTILFLMTITTVGFVKEYYKINRPEIIKAGLAVRKIVPKDSLIIAPYNGDTAFLYQTSRRGWPVVDFPIQELIDRGAEYFVSVDLDHYQTVEFSEKYDILEITDDYVILKLI